MAFKKDETAAGTNESWKSDGFLNIYIPTKSGGRRKVGSIGLKNSKPFEADLIKRLSEGGEEAAKAMKEVIELEFNLAEPTSEDGMAAF